MNAPASSGTADPSQLLPRRAAASTRHHDSRARRHVDALLARWRVGTLELHRPGAGTSRHIGSSDPSDVAVLHLHDERLYRAVLAHGDIGLAETYIDGGWDSPDLPGLLRLLIRNRDALERVVYGHPWLSLVYRLTHLLRRNSRAGSQRNIHAHYDLGNAFYALWLDESMSYSSAWFDGDPSRSLADAQQRKIERALDAAQVRAGSRMLDIGCGWGALADAAARRGASVTGLTLSREQLTAARARLDQSQRVADIRLQDYRDLADGPAGTYDAIVSIEMFEAVGRAYWDTYFHTLAHTLAPNGAACVQTITIDDTLFERYARSTDFIQQYVFPGGMLPSPSQFRAHAERAGLRVIDTLAFGRDYAHTLRHWRTRFDAALPAVRKLGFDPRFERLWHFYLAYCEAAFDTAQTDVMQFTLRHADHASAAAR